jgi:hypothetical protein
MIELSQAKLGEEAGGVRVRFEDARPSVDPAWQSQQLLSATASGECVVDRRVTDVPGRSSAAVSWPLAARTKGERPRFDERYDLVGEPESSSVGRRERRCTALDLLSLASADDPFEHCPPYLINEVIVDRVVSSEHSIDKRPVERVDKGFQIEIG